MSDLPARTGSYNRPPPASRRGSGFADLSVSQADLGYRVVVVRVSPEKQQSENSGMQRKAAESSGGNSGNGELIPIIDDIFAKGSALLRRGQTSVEPRVTSNPD